MAENTAASISATFLEKNGLKFDLAGDNKECIFASFSMKNRTNMNVCMIFSEDNTAVKIIASDFVKFPEDKRESLYKIINRMNSSYRWIKFCIREDIPVIIAEDDAVIQLNSCGEEVLRCCAQLVKICDDAYPEIMKIIYG